MNTRNVSLQRASRVLCALLFVPALLSCGSANKGSSQVVATVNGREITMTQLNRALESAGVREVTPDTRKRALASLTAEELMVQAALENKIDRDASFVQALEQSRRQLLAQHFAERMIYPKTLVSAAEITDYFNHEPLLFAKRRTFRFTTFQANRDEVTPAVMQELEPVTSVDGVRTVLDAHGIKYVTELARVSPEQLPVDELDAYSVAKVGDLFVNPQRDGTVLLMSVTGIEDDVPVTLERARPLIEEYLRNSRNRKATEDYLKSARAGAQIVYTQAEPPPGTEIAQRGDIAGRPAVLARTGE